MWRFSAAVVVALVIASCGGGAPTAPSTPTPSVLPGVVSVTPQFPELIVAGESVQLRLAVAFDNGAQDVVTQGASWTSSNPSVANVDDTGKMTAHAMGRVTIKASIKGASASAAISVVPDVSGVWAVTMPKGDGRWTNLTFAEIEQDTNVLSGRWRWDSSVEMAIEGTVNEKGVLSLSARDCYAGYTYGSTLITASDWTMAVAGKQSRYEGSMTMSVSGRYMGGPCSGWILRDEAPTVTKLPVAIVVQ